jgi:predicted nucleotidyltransferase
VPREKVLALLRQHWAEIQAKFGVERLMLFGSTARGEAHAGSDIDLLVRFSAPPGYDGYFALKCYLEALLGAPVDGGPAPWAPMRERTAVSPRYVECARKVVRYTAHLTREQFFSSELEYDATLRNLEILGEARRKFPTS